MSFLFAEINARLVNFGEMSEMRGLIFSPGKSDDAIHKNEMQIVRKHFVSDLTPKLRVRINPHPCPSLGDRDRTREVGDLMSNDVG